MQTYFHSRVFLCSLLLAAAKLPAADLLVKQVTLYKHGIGFFEREGSIPAGEEARLDFKNTDMNDVLKSLTVSDTAGGHISGIRYDSNESLTQQLEKYPFRIGNGELLSAFLDGIKGARLEVKTGDRTVTGTILSARALSVGAEADRRAFGEQITLLLDSGDVANHFAGPITVKKNQSAMLPFLQDKISARKLLIYTENDGEHPVNAAEITNNTAKTLDGGPSRCSTLAPMPAKPYSNLESGR
jgi:hypothetical protein